jgi:hypothetical protein
LLWRNGVSYVALPDTTFDPSSQNEARLVRNGPHYLDPVYRDAHWTVYSVAGSPTLLDGPGHLLAVGGRRIVFDARRPGRFTLRVRSFAAWQVEGGDACTGTSADGWLTVDAAMAGRIVLTQQDPLRSFIHDHTGQSCLEAARLAA